MTSVLRAGRPPARFAASRDGSGTGFDVPLGLQAPHARVESVGLDQLVVTSRLDDAAARLLEAKHDCDQSKTSIKMVDHMVETGKKAVEAAQKGLARSEALARYERMEGANAAKKLAKLSTDST